MIDSCPALKKLEFVDTNELTPAVQSALGNLGRLGALAAVGEHLQQFASGAKHGAPFAPCLAGDYSPCFASGPGSAGSSRNLATLDDLE